MPYGYGGGAERGRKVGRLPNPRLHWMRVAAKKATLQKRLPKEGFVVRGKVGSLLQTPLAHFSMSKVGKKLYQVTVRPVFAAAKRPTASGKLTRILSSRHPSVKTVVSAIKGSTGIIKTHRTKRLSGGRGFMTYRAGGGALHGMRASPSGKIHVKAHSTRGKGGKMVRVKAHLRKRGRRR